MSSLLFVQPIRPTAITASRGSGAARLLTDDPREAWQDETIGSEATLTIDLGAAQQVDTLFLGFTNAALASSMVVTSGVASATETTWTSAVLPADSARRRAPRHGFAWRSTLRPDGRRQPDPIAARYIAVRVKQGVGGGPLYAGVLMVGACIQPGFGHEYGSGRTPIDTGSRERLPSGGFATSPGVKKGSWDFTMGDLSSDEVARLYDLSLEVGETGSVLVVEDPDATAGLAERLHWSMIDKLQAYERLNPALTRWAFRVEDWG